VVKENKNIVKEIYKNVGDKSLGDVQLKEGKQSSNYAHYGTPAYPYTNEASIIYAKQGWYK